MILNDLQDERLLLVRARPHFALAVVPNIAVAVHTVVAVGGMPVRVAVGMSVAHVLVAAIAGAVASVGAGNRQESRLLDVAVDAALRQGVEPGRLRFDLFDVREFDPNGDAELMRGIPGESELLAVVGFELNSHGDAFP